MQLQLFIPLCLVFLCVVDSRRTEFQRHFVPYGYRMINVTDSPDNPTSTENLPPMPTSEYPEETESSEEWPYAMMEFTSLFGRCLTAKHMKKMMRMEGPKDKFLSGVCPRLLKLAKFYADSSEIMRETVVEFAEGHFDLLQCVNLLAVKDNVLSIMGKMRPGKFRSFKSGRKSNRGMDEESQMEGKKPEMEGVKGMAKVLFEEAKGLFEMCEKTFSDAFESLEELGTEFEQEMKFSPEERYFEQILRKALNRH